MPRRALLSHVEANRDLPVIVVHAGAGFGKSTLAAQWAAQDPRPHAIVRVAPFLNDPAALALRLIEALGSLGPPSGELQSLATGVEPDFSALLLPSLTQLAASRGRPYVLVVDDIHLLGNKAKTQDELTEAMEQVVRRIPGQNYEFSQPVELRMNELVSGVRSDVAVKVYGDEMDILRKYADLVEDELKGIAGAQDIKVEQVAGRRRLRDRPLCRPPRTRADAGSPRTGPVRNQRRFVTMIHSRP